MYLRDLAVHADDSLVERYKGGFVQRFQREACSVVEPYLAEINRKVVTEDTAKVGFTFTDETGKPPEYSPGRCFYPWPFDFAAYAATATQCGKQRLILESLHNALKWIAKRKLWVTDPLDAAYKSITDRNFEFIGFSKNSWLCPNKRFRARVSFDWQFDRIDLFAVLYRNHSKVELARLQLGTAVPMAGILHDYLNAGKWQSSTTFAVSAQLPFRKEWAVDFSDRIAKNTT